MTEQLSDEKLHQLEGAAANYRTTYQAHLANPLDSAAVQAWDEATRQLMAVINNDEANIIAQLLARQDAELAASPPQRTVETEPFGFTEGDKHGMVYEPRHADRLKDPRPVFKGQPMAQLQTSDNNSMPRK
ncbi:TPA: hypothetical protein ACIBH9_001584 [Salmonella enterica subsp. diarizonae serovar 61:l,v:z35]